MLFFIFDIYISPSFFHKSISMVTADEFRIWSRESLNMYPQQNKYKMYLRNCIFELDNFQLWQS